MWRCKECEIAYLDPRPNERSVHLAYKDYYTHEPKHPAESSAENNLLKSIRQKIRNGYTNLRYGTNINPSSSIGVPIMYLLGRKGRVDRTFRYLPRINKENNKLLDIGCGNGAFINFASKIGWNAIGIDFDQSAVINCTQQGMKVHLGGIEMFESKKKIFDVITISHVIEHLHNPKKMLQICNNLLVEGGMLWIETPNIDSFGHRKFGNTWRGLEPPRHLSIFNFRSLRDTLEKCGFSNICFHYCPGVTRSLYRESKALFEENSSSQREKRTLIFAIEANLADMIGRFFYTKREFITVTARKLPQVK